MNIKTHNMVQLLSVLALAALGSAMALGTAIAPFAFA